MELLASPVELQEIVKMVLIFAQGSCSSGVWWHKTPESTIVAQRIIYDGVMNADSLFQIQVDCKMMKYVNRWPTYID